jgi:hypothetical protein
MLACWLIAKKNYTAEQALTSIGYQHRENKILSYEQLNFVYIYENHLKNPRITIPDSVPDKPVAQPQSSPLSCLFTRLKHLIK